MEEKTMKFVFGGGETQEVTIPEVQEPVNEEAQEKAPLNEAMQHSIFVVCIDKSGSMGKTDTESGKSRMQLVNEYANGLITTDKIEEVDKDNCDMAIIAFDTKVQIVKDFAPLSSMTPDIELKDTGLTALHSALVCAVGMARNRRNALVENGITTYKPIIFLLTDGAPTDEKDMGEMCRKVLAHYCDNAVDESGEVVKKKKMTLIVMGMPGCDMGEMSRLCKDVQLVMLKDSDALKAAFDLIVFSIASVSSTKADDDIEISLQHVKNLGVIASSEDERKIGFAGGNTGGQI